MYVLYAKQVSSSNQESEIMMLTLQSCDQESQIPHHEPKDSSKTMQICVGEIHVEMQHKIQRVNKVYIRFLFA